jgi:bile acid:Na+ symporter, BASS family
MDAEPSAFATIVLAASLVVIMTSLGLGLTVDDFKRVVVYPKGIGIGLANLVLISPLLAFGIAELFDLPAALAVGIVLLGASPGGAMANMLTHLARGDVALSISMTAISSVCAVITVPIFLTLAVDRFGAGLDVDVEMLPIVGRIFAVTIIPLSIGMWLRARRPDWTERNYDGFRRAALAFFGIAVIVTVIAEHDKVFDSFGDVIAATLALNVIAMALSFTIAKLVRLSDRQATAIAMELGIHNAALAIAVAATLTTQLAIPAAVYASFMFVTAGLFARAIYRRNTAEPVPVPEG